MSFALGMFFNWYYLIVNMVNGNIRVLVAGPTYDGMRYCHDKFIDRLKDLSYDNYDILLVDNSDDKKFFKELKKESEIEVIHLSLKNVPKMKRLVRSRNKILSYAMEKDYDYVLMMDVDVIVPIDIIERLLGHGKEIVSGLYFSLQNVDHRQKVKSVAWKFLTEDEWDEVKGRLMSDIVREREDVRRNLTDEEIESGKLQEVAIPSCGCMLISRDIFSRCKYGVLDVPGKLHSSDDIYFSRKLREAGVKLYCDPSIKCEHLTEGKFGEDGAHPLRH